jgi:hypothetical protein
MTLQYLLNGCPSCDYSNIEIFIENNPVYDFKGGDQTIILISGPFENLDKLQPITLQEVIQYSKELNYPEDNITFLCEQELQELKSSEWHGTKLMLYF